ncbi:MAG: hypothetical protein NDI88_11325, partial [Lysobacter sp.]|nr:hypothetical protein [Lysobacter sp.]
ARGEEECSRGEKHRGEQRLQATQRDEIHDLFPFFPGPATRFIIKSAGYGRLLKRNLQLLASGIW